MRQTSLHLPPRLDLKAVGALQNQILSQRGTDLALDAGEVEHLGALAAQLIRSAARTWAEDGHALALNGASTDLAEQLALLGFTPATITQWEPV